LAGSALADPIVCDASQRSEDDRKDSSDGVIALPAHAVAILRFVLSHGHWDHAGAMLRALQLIMDRNGG